MAFYGLDTSYYDQAVLGSPVPVPHPAYRTQVSPTPSVDLVYPQYQLPQNITWNSLLLHRLYASQVLSIFHETTFYYKIKRCLHLLNYISKITKILLCEKDGENSPSSSFYIGSARFERKPYCENMPM